MSKVTCCITFGRNCIKTLSRIRIPARPLVKPPVEPTTSTSPPRVPEKRGREDSDEDGASSSDVPAVKRLRRKVPHPPHSEVRVTPTSDEEVEISLIRRPLPRIRTPPPLDSMLFVHRSSSPFGMPGTPSAMMVSPGSAVLASFRASNVHLAGSLVPEGDLIDFMGSSPSAILEVSLRLGSMVLLIPATSKMERLRRQLKEIEAERNGLCTRMGELETLCMELELQVGAMEMERDHLRGIEHSLQDMDIRLGTAERERDNFEESLGHEQDLNHEARRFYDKWGDEDLVALDALRRIKLEAGEGPDTEGGLFERNAVLKHRIQELTKIVDKLRDENRALLMDGKAVQRGVQHFHSVMSEYELQLAGVLTCWRVQSDKRLEYNIRSIQEAMRKSLVEEAADPSVLFPIHSIPMFERDYGL
ncbi:hypothetical protein Hypma_000172 [Hypsizygus marmoreus]|uniref:Uncharacterized protein n=1 Tax=Hypsizygus marmoreus TaxID=39966 RepID=A0A369KDM0_HYPMA|nr:hypothetical protein Hypma_000172 [Hypsizygus marmoreus]